MRDTDEETGRQLADDDHPTRDEWRDRVLGQTCAEALAQRPRRNAKVAPPAPPNKVDRRCRKGHVMIGNGVCYQCRDGHP